MANKKISQVEETNEEVDMEEPELFQGGDYYSALVKVKGKRDLVKIRGIVSLSDDYTLLNAQGVGEEADCDDDEHGFSYELYVGDSTQSALDMAGVKEFSLVTDARAKKVIENDQLDEIAGHRPRKLSNGKISFGCGAVEVTVDEITNWLKFMEKIQSMKGWEKFLDLNEKIATETDVNELKDIKLKDVRKILE
jgi:hypothetical protein